MVACLLGVELLVEGTFSRSWELDLALAVVLGSPFEGCEPRGEVARQLELVLKLEQRQ